MADEQDWAAFADQNHLKATDTILARTSAGAGVEIPGGHVVARRADGEPFKAPGPIQGGFGGDTTVGVDDWNDGSNAISGSGKKILNAGSLNHPPFGSLYYAFSFEAGSAKDGSGNMTQFAIPYVSSNPFFLRTKLSGSWSNWREILSANNSGNFQPYTNGTANLGGSATRFAVVYAATGSINTSDEREKTWRGAMTDDEYAAALQIIDEMGFYQWNDSIAVKGEDARYHFGARVQRVIAILDDHLGEDEWHKYAFACHDSWDAEYADVLDEAGDIVPDAQGDLTREAGDVYGLRPDQFTMFLMTAQARRQSALEERIAELETA